MSSRIVQQLRHPRTGEMMHRVIHDPRGITLEQYRKIDRDAVRAFGINNVITKGENIGGTDGNKRKISTFVAPYRGYEIQQAQ